jgi:Mn-containing catalase
VNEYFNGSTGDGSEGETDMRGPWQAAFGLHPVESEINGGPGLSIDEINGTEGQEERGKQDAGQKAATSVFTEALSQTSPSTNKPGASSQGKKKAPVKSSAKKDATKPKR